MEGSQAQHRRPHPHPPPLNLRPALHPPSPSGLARPRSLPSPTPTPSPLLNHLRGHNQRAPTPSQPRRPSPTSLAALSPETTSASLGPTVWQLPMAPAARRARGHRRNLDSTTRTTGRAQPIPPPPAAGRPPACAPPRSQPRRKCGGGGRGRRATAAAASARRGAAVNTLYFPGPSPRHPARAPPAPAGRPHRDGAALPHLPAPTRPPWPWSHTAPALTPFPAVRPWASPLPLQPNPASASGGHFTTWLRGCKGPSSVLVSVELHQITTPSQDLIQRRSASPRVGTGSTEFKFLRSNVWHIIPHLSIGDYCYSQEEIITHDFLPPGKELFRTQFDAPERNHEGKNCKPCRAQSMAWHAVKVFRGHQVPWKASLPGD